jgi:hypothetical protein
MDGLFTCHVVGWRKILPNQVEGKLFPLYNVFNWNIFLS